MKIKWILIPLLGLLISFGSAEPSEGQGADEEVFLQFRYQGIINEYLSTLYQDDQFYISIGDLFSALIIDHRIDTGRLRVEGSYPNRGTFSIRFIDQTATVGFRTIHFTADDFIISDFGYYLKMDLFEELFMMTLSVDFGNLSMILETPDTMPIVAQRQRSLRRERLLRTQQEIRREYYPIRYDRDTSFLNLGFFDYELTTNFGDAGSGIGYNTRIGAEVAGGDLQGSILGSYTEQASVFRTTGLRWRYGSVNNPLVSIVQLGQSRSSGITKTSYTGIQLTNQPIEPRFLYGETSLTGTSVPEAEVELFRNNTLIDYTQADPDGFYRFNVPITYGSSQYQIRTYNPAGLLEQRNLRYQIPNTFLPAGEVNYTIDAGRLENPIAGSLERGFMGQGNVRVGLSNRFTAGAGVEYFDDFHESLPTFSGLLSSRVLTNHLITFEAANDAFYRGSIQAIYANNASFTAEYTHFTSTDRLYNPGRLESVLRTNLFTPFQIRNFPLFLRWNFSVENRENLNAYRYRVDLNTRLGRTNVRVGYTDSQTGRIDWRTTPSARLSASSTYTFRSARNRRNILNSLFVRGQVRYFPALNQFENAEVQLSRRVGGPGRFQFSYGRNFIGNFNLIRFTFSLDFNSFRSNTNARSNRSNVNVSQTFRGSVGYDSSNQNFIMTNRQQVGQSAVAVRLFVDNNNSGTYDEGDTLIPDQAVRIERSSSRTQTREGISYITQLQAYRRYNLIINRGAINNPLLIPIIDRFSFITDPNQFKTIDIPFYTSGIIEGRVNRVRDSVETGLGGVRLFMVQVDAPEGIEPFREEIRTFSDGSFYAFEIPPAEYEIRIDQTQLNFLNATANPEVLEFTVRPLSEGDFVEGLVINVVSKDPEEDITPIDETEAETVSEITEPADERTEDVAEMIVIERIEDPEFETGILSDELIRDPNQERIVSDIEIFTQDASCRFSIQMAEYTSLSEAFNGADRYESEIGVPFQVYSNGPNEKFNIRTVESDHFGRVLTNFNRIVTHFLREKPAIITQCRPHEQVGPLRYYIQLAALSTRESAENLRQLLRDSYDLDSRIIETAGGLHRVQAGPFHGREDLLYAFRILSNEEISPGLFIIIDPTSYSNNRLEYRLQAGVFSNQRDAVRYAFEISEAFHVDTFVIVDGTAVKVMVKKDYNQWDEIFRDFTDLSAYSSTNGVAIHLLERE